MLKGCIFYYTTRIMILKNLVLENKFYSLYMYNNIVFKNICLNISFFNVL